MSRVYAAVILLPLLALPTLALAQEREDPDVALTQARDKLLAKQRDWQSWNLKHEEPPVPMPDVTLSTAGRPAWTQAAATDTYPPPGPAEAAPQPPPVVVVPPPAQASSPAEDAVWTALGAMLTALAPVVAWFASQLLLALAARVKVQVAAADAAKMENEIQAALSVGVAKTIPEIRLHGWSSPLVWSKALTESAHYFSERFPDRVLQINAAAGTKPDEGSVAKTLEGRLPAAIAAAAASPATPPVGPSAVVSPLTQPKSAGPTPV